LCSVTYSAPVGMLLVPIRSWMWGCVKYVEPDLVSKLIWLYIYFPQNSKQEVKKMWRTRSSPVWGGHLIFLIACQFQVFQKLQRTARFHERTYKDPNSFRRILGFFSNKIENRGYI
jgi:hypothetical protein